MSKATEWMADVISNAAARGLEPAEGPPNPGQSLRMINIWRRRRGQPPLTLEEHREAIDGIED